MVAGRGRIADGVTTTVAALDTAERRSRGRPPARRSHRRDRRQSHLGMDRAQARDRAPRGRRDPDHRRATRPAGDAHRDAGNARRPGLPRRLAVDGVSVHRADDGGAGGVPSCRRHECRHGEGNRPAVHAVGSRAIQQELLVRRAEGGFARGSRTSPVLGRESSTRAASSSRRRVGADGLARRHQPRARAVQRDPAAALRRRSCGDRRLRVGRLTATAREVRVDYRRCSPSWWWCWGSSDPRALARCSSTSGRRSASSGRLPCRGVGTDLERSDPTRRSTSGLSPSVVARRSRCSR